MKRLAQVWALPLALFLLFTSLSAVCAAQSNATSPAQPSASVLDSGKALDSGCSTAGELLRRLREEPGGTIQLTGDIELASSARVKIDRPTVVRMGGYGIHITGEGFLWLEGPVRFEGGGGTKPLFAVEGELAASDGVEIAAQWEGAVAVHVTGAGGVRLSNCQVFAEGSGAVAVRMETGEPYFPEQTDFLARGPDSRAIEAAGPVQAFLCRIRSEGGEAIVSGGEVRLLSCVASRCPQARKAAASMRFSVHGWNKTASACRWGPERMRWNRH